MAAKLCCGLDGRFGLKVLVIGASGLIGAHVTRALGMAGHQVLGLCRSDVAAQKVARLEAEVVIGDLARPKEWATKVHDVEAVVHVAAAWGPDMGAVDRAMIEALVDEARCGQAKPRFLYTGGVWLYGAGQTRHEGAPFAPIAPFAWMVENAEYLRTSEAFDLAVVHPGLVYTSDMQGSFAGFAAAGKAGQKPEILESEAIRWPLIHVQDLAEIYADLVTRHGVNGDFNAVTEAGIPVGQICDAVTRAMGHQRKPEVISRAAALAAYGDMALGPMLDQVVRGARLAELGLVPRHVDFRASLMRGGE
jgi:nucleoside-diphosphate-sugar epimerase